MVLSSTSSCLSTTLSHLTALALVQLESHSREMHATASGTGLGLWADWGMKLVPGMWQGSASRYRAGEWGLGMPKRSRKAEGQE